MADFPLVLAGPIVRRVEPTNASVWLALSQPSQVKLDLYQGPVSATALPATVGTQTASTLQIGQNLHIVVVTAAITGLTVPGSEISYNVTVTPSGGAALDLRALDLLKATTVNGYAQPPLGYLEDFLPRFRTPPPALSNLRLVQGGCRKPHDAGADALAKLAEFLAPAEDASAPIPPVLDIIPQLLFLSGDQIYGDDVSLPLLPLLTTTGNELIGGSPEPLPLSSGPALPATLEHFPPGLRDQVVRSADAKFTSTDADCHLLSFAEYCTMYLMVFSNALWPAESSFGPPTVVNLSAATPDHAPAVQAFLSGKSAAELSTLSAELRQKYCAQLSAIKEFAHGLGKVRQALANVATYMIHDDHEVTDDWYLSLKWKEEVMDAPLGRQVLRNALVAYAFFQGWGNDPAAFETGGANAGFLTTAATAITGGQSTAIAALDTALGLGTPVATTFPDVQWSYRLLHESLPYGFLVLDERTRRGFRSRESSPARIEPTTEMPQQIPVANELALAGRKVLFVVAGAPVLGLPIVEELLQPAFAYVSDLRHARAPTGLAEGDREPWSGQAIALERLLASLAPARRIVFLSGDVHFGHGAEMTYWPAAGPPARFVQFTSSALKNSGAAWQLNIIRNFGFAQRIFRFGESSARLGWNLRTPTPLTFPGAEPLAAYPPEVRSRFLTEPVLLPASKWPTGVAFQRNPDWVWSLRLLFDERPDSEREDDRPLLLPQVPSTGAVPLSGFPEIARYHTDAMKKRGVSRQTVFSHNIGVVAVSEANDTITATHTLFSIPMEEPDELEPITIHTASLEVDATQPKPGLQS